jgi:hypothetical protein
MYSARPASLKRIEIELLLRTVLLHLYLVTEDSNAQIVALPLPEQTPFVDALTTVNLEQPERSALLRTPSCANPIVYCFSISDFSELLCMMRMLIRTF